MTNVDAPIACTLDAGSLWGRLEWMRNLRDRALLRCHRDGLALHLVFDAAAKEEVRALVRRERACCAFLRFELAEAEQELHLTVTVPPEADDFADEILEYFAPVRDGTGLER